MRAVLPRTTFDLTSNNRESTSIDVWADAASCDFESNWNAWICAQDYAILLFDSLDEDRMDRSAQPIWIYGYQLDRNGEEQPICDRAGNCFKNRLNAFMDHCWDGFYTCQQREQRFPTMVYQPADTYWVEYTGTPPKNQKFILHADGGTGFKVRIKYSDAGAYSIFDENNQVVAPTDWSAETGTYADLPRRACGENRYQGVLNILEFFIDPGCMLTIRPRDAIMLGVRLEFTMNEFFAAGGVVSFTDRIAGALGIHRSDIRIAGVQENSAGQTSVEFQGMSDEVGGESIERAGRRELSNGNRRRLLDLGEIDQAFRDFVSDTDDFMGAPLLGAVAQGVNLIVPRTPFDDNGNPIFEVIQSAGEALGLDDSDLLIDEGSTEPEEEDPEV